MNYESATRSVLVLVCLPGKEGSACKSVLLLLSYSLTLLLSYSLTLLQCKVSPLTFTC